MKVEELDDTEVKDGASVKGQQDKDKAWEKPEVRIHCQTKKNRFFSDGLWLIIVPSYNCTRDLNIHPVVGSRKNVQ